MSTSVLHVHTQAMYTAHTHLITCCNNCQKQRAVSYKPPRLLYVVRVQKQPKRSDQTDNYSNQSCHVTRDNSLDSLCHIRQ